ncbi:hypothetical protein BOS5A_210719 [Bosea sp. EC-HK365B]|nr:hypothetical protein BOSE21B_30332 [Bosea sp. 21B]VVT59928.1 hypothetical protein BOS5A_210719 [Bosea sp. EC-HK365B]VXC10511.1 hypothetical protein BOSE127_170219 [Bosea sp. 127]
MKVMTPTPRDAGFSCATAGAATAPNETARAAIQADLIMVFLSVSDRRPVRAPSPSLRNCGA